MTKFLYSLFAVFTIITLTPLSIKAQCNPDGVAPTWTNCPSSVSIVSNDGCLPYKWVPPTLSDNCTGQLDTLNTNTNYNGACLPANSTINVVYLASDLSGNVGVCSFTITVVTGPCFDESTPPDIANCPSNITTSVSKGGCIAVNWVEPTITDNCDNAPKVRISVANGTCFQVGTKEVVYIAEDASHNKSICRFTVLVNEILVAPVANLISNPTFGAALAGFDNLGNALLTVDGVTDLTAAVVTGGSGGVGFTQNVVPNGTYTFKSTNKLSSTAVAAKVNIKFLDINLVPIAGTDTTLQITGTSYADKTITATAPTGAYYIQAAVLKTSTTGSVTTDDWTLTATAPPPIAFMGNVIPNGGFESDFTNYDDLDDQAVTREARCGSKAAKVGCTRNGRLAFTKDCVPNGTYTFQGFSKVSGTTDGCTVGLKFYDANANYIPNSERSVKVTTNCFTETRIEQKAPANAAYVRVCATKTSTSGSFVTDDWCFKETAPAPAVVDNSGLSACDNDRYNPSKCYKIVNRASGKVLEVKDWSTAFGAQIEQRTYTGQNNQKWKLVSVGNDYRKIFNVHSNKFLANSDGGNNSNCKQYNFNTDGAKDWKLECTPDGYVTMKHHLSGRYLDLENGGSSSDGADAVIYNYDGSISQQWQIIEVPCQNYAYMVRQNDPNARLEEKTVELGDINSSNDTDGQDVVNSVKANDTKVQSSTKLSQVNDETAANIALNQKTVTGHAKVYPNPAHSFVRIDMTGYQNADVQIQMFNLMGTVIKIKKVESNSVQTVEMNIDDLAAGTYLIRVKANGFKDQIQKINVMR